MEIDISGRCFFFNTPRQNVHLFTFHVFINRSFIFILQPHNISISDIFFRDLGVDDLWWIVFMVDFCAITSIQFRLLAKFYLLDQANL